MIYLGVLTFLIFFNLMKQIIYYKVLNLNKNINMNNFMGIGDWGLGIGDWGLGRGPKTPKPKTQTPKPRTH
jgi:hypothetical protein